MNSRESAIGRIDNPFAEGSALPLRGLVRAWPVRIVKRARSPVIHYPKHLPQLLATCRDPGSALAVCAREQYRNVRQERRRDILLNHPHQIGKAALARQFSTRSASAIFGSNPSKSGSHGCHCPLCLRKGGTVELPACPDPTGEASLIDNPSEPLH